MNAPHQLLKTAALRAVEQQAQADLAPHELMRRAARSAFDTIAARWPSHAVLVLCGPGNNGGDGFMLATLLHQAGRQVSVWALPTSKNRPADAHQAWLELPPDLLQAPAPDTSSLADDTLIVDALFGLGLARPLPTLACRWIEWANAQPVERLALDLPSGLDADTGNLNPIALVATHTLTFIADKPGLHTRAGPDHSGLIELAALALDPPSYKLSAPDEAGYLIQKNDCASLFTRRKQDTHKGSFGSTGIIGGARGMTGAALLAGRAALRSGAGKVFVGIAQSASSFLSYDSLQPELMLRPAHELLDNAQELGITNWIAGCGLGVSPDSEQLLQRLIALHPKTPMVLDADALNLLSSCPQLESSLKAHAGTCVLTPHPREAAALLGLDTEKIQADRIEAARRLAMRYQAWVVLKGAGTVVSSPLGDWSINGSGNPGLATAGTGDVLAGILGALLAQGLPIGDSVRCAVWLHGAAADKLAALGIGPIGLTASEVIDAARTLRNAPRR